MKPIGIWPTKFDALLRRILHMRASHPDEKHLVFSYYDDALKLIKGALQANGISHVEYMGGIKVSFMPATAHDMHQACPSGSSRQPSHCRVCLHQLFVAS